MYKKLLSTFISFLLILTVFAPIPLCASAAPEDVMLTSSDKRIEVCGDKIYVYSPWYEQWHAISSAKLLTALSSDGYSLSYLNKDYRQQPSSNVHDGYIYAEKNGRGIYFEIFSNSADVYSEDFAEFSKSGYYLHFPKEYKSYWCLLNGMYGKDESDTSFIISANEEENLAGGVYLQKNLPFTADTVYTIEYSVYNDSNADAGFFIKTENSEINLLSLKGSGSATVLNYDEGNSIKRINYVEPKRRHSIAVEFDYYRSRVITYIDGVLQGDAYHTLSNAPAVKYVKFIMSGDGTQKLTGNIAYDDIRIYKGYYNNTGKINIGAVSDKFALSETGDEIYGACGMKKTDVLSFLHAEQELDAEIEDSIISNGTKLYILKNGTRISCCTFRDGDYISKPYVQKHTENEKEIIESSLTICRGSGNRENIYYFIATYRRDLLTDLRLQIISGGGKTTIKNRMETDSELEEETKIVLLDSGLNPLVDKAAATKNINVFEDDEFYRRLLSDYICIHAQSGVFTYYGEKYLLENKPYSEGGRLYVNGMEISRITGSEPLSDTYVRADDIFVNSLHLIKTVLSAEYNGGAVLYGNSQFSTSADLQKLNNYLFYLRPDAKKINEYYRKSKNCGQHPRLQLNAEGFDRIRNTDNALKISFKNEALSLANWYITELERNGAPQYVIDGGGRLLGVSRKVLERIYAFSFAYQMTWDMKYVNAAYTYLEAVCAFPDWHPEHTIDTGEMCAAVSIGYDWLYDALTPKQRSFIEQGIYKNGFGAAISLYGGLDSPRDGAVNTKSNWGAVCNGGIAIAAMAMLDVYPVTSAKILSNALRGYEYTAQSFAPHGAWYEGPLYWEYTMQYTAKWLSSLETALNTDFGFLSCEGLDETAYYIMNMQSAQGEYAYSEGLHQTYYVPEILWLAKVYNNNAVASSLMHLSENAPFLRDSSGTISGNSEDMVLAAMWYEPDMITDNIELPLESFYENEAVFQMRSGWSKDDSYFAAAARVLDGSEDDLDSGSFVFDTCGVRWIDDPGRGDYGTAGYWDTVNGKRWKIFNKRAEAHSAFVIDPSGTGADQVFPSKSYFEKTETDENGGIAIINLTPAYSDSTFSARRGFFFTDSKASLVIRDEITLKKQSEVFWSLITAAEAEIDADGKGAVLTMNGQQLKFEFSSSCGAQLSFAKSVPLVNPDGAITGGEEGKYNRLLVKYSGNGKVNITAKLSPYDKGGDLSEYEKPIDSWALN